MNTNEISESSHKVPERIHIAPKLQISRIVTGLWQVADMEKEGTDLDVDIAAQAMLDYFQAGFTTFDMADHYGSSELITAHFLSKLQQNSADTNILRPEIFTKWCPKPKDMTASVVNAGVEERMERLNVDIIDLLQFHWWNYEHPEYLNALNELEKLRRNGLIANLGLTNFDTDHLRLILDNGVHVATNQVSLSLIDQRAAGRMTELCLARNVSILAYGTLCGGFLTDRWVGIPESEMLAITDWSKMKYGRFIQSFGGWEKFQVLLEALVEISHKYGVSVANVATRWVIEQPAVSAVIVGARLGERQHRKNNIDLFSFALDADDYECIDRAMVGSIKIPRDCGSEYRKPPFLTASGDLSHHLDSIENGYTKSKSTDYPNRSWVSSNTLWEKTGGFARAVRKGQHIFVSGTTATDLDGQKISESSVEGQAVFILDKIIAAVRALGGSERDITRTRIYITDEKYWEAITATHGRYFSDVLPANTLVVVDSLIGNYEVEIEAEAVVSNDI
ncbi:MAG: aldo/keto reductase [Acidiferrobacteraceae bacterium]|nr:aldo/keto reductase [Acidiferrobacteraceae bacterium]|tara:strand:+ start:79 stop:1599 length:1521 start_codon:yes stop_codon:yes gene_type:complete